MKISIMDLAIPRLEQLKDRLNGPARQELNEAMGVRVESVVKDAHSHINRAPSK